MLRALWYLIKIIVLVGIAIFLYVQPGDVAIAWREYKLSAPLGLVAVAILALVFFVSVFSEISTRLSLLPRNIARARAEKRRTKGYRALLQSLSAAAIGDQKNAYYLAHRAQKFLPEDESGLPLLLQAQAQTRQAGAAGINDEPYKALLKNADTALLGLQGLTQNAILAGDFAKALVLARQSLKDNPKNYAILKAVYDLEIRNRLWNDALVTLQTAEKRKVIASVDADHDRVAIYLSLGDMAADAGRTAESFAFYKQAYKRDDEFAPVVVRYARALFADGARRKAVSVIETAWKRQPHPSYLPVWADMAPDKANAKYRWFDSLVKLNPESDMSHLAVARAAIDESLWGEAKSSLAKAEKLHQSAELYELWVRLEEKTTNRPDVIRQWLDRAYTAPKGGVWICAKTGKCFDDWRAVVEPEGVFNTLYWNADGILSSPVIHGVLTASS